MKILKKIIILIIITMIVLFSLIPPKITLAATSVSQVGDAIASTAIDFYNRYGKNTIYDYGCKYRGDAYKGKITASGTAYGLNYKWQQDFTNKYPIDCVGFVSMIVHRATGLGGNDFTTFGVPTGSSPSGVSWAATSTFESFSGDMIQRGDIICWSDHVGIAVGNGMMVDSGSAGLTGAYDGKEISYRAVSAYSGSYCVVRIKSTALSSVRLNTTWYNVDNLPDDGGTTDPIIVDPVNPDPVDPDPVDPDISDDSGKYVIHINTDGIGRSKLFYYNGEPISGEYLGKAKEGNWLIKTLADVADWLVGIMTLGYKVQIVGWSAEIQNMATDIVSTIVGEEKDGTVTAEKILFNQVPILDINFFNMKEAGHHSINEENIEYTLRQHVAGIYNTIRNIVIIAMLVVLLYVGIRMAISTIAKDKAVYKRMLWSWVVGFIVVMFIHYFMIVVINVNSQIVDLIAPSSEDGSIMYDTARSYAYEIPASKGWTGTIVYVFLLYYLIKLLIFYFKRLFIVYILAIMGPIMGAAYAMQMIKGKSKSLSMWMREFAFNVLIQSIHIIIYSVFMSVIFKIMISSNIINLLGTAIVMVLVINLMLRSEKIVKNIFGLKASSMKDIMDSVIQTSQSITAAIAVTKPLYNYGKSVFIDAYDAGISRKIDEKYKHLELSKEELESSEVAREIQKGIDALKAQEKKQIKDFDSSTIKLAKNIFGRGIGGVVQSIPMMFEAGPVEGTLGLVNAGIAMDSELNVRKNNIDVEKLDELLLKYGFDPTEIKRDSKNISEYRRLANIYVSHVSQNMPQVTAQKGTRAYLMQDAIAEESNPIRRPIVRKLKNDNIERNNNQNKPSDGKQNNSEPINSKPNNGKPSNKKSNVNTNKQRIKSKPKNNAVEIKYHDHGLLRTVASLATAGTTKRMDNIILGGMNGYEAINDSVQTRRIELLYKLQKMAVQEEKKLNGSIEILREKRNSPLFIKIEPGDSKEIIAMKNSLKKQYKEQLKLNLEQAIAGKPSVEKSDISKHLTNYSVKNGKVPQSFQDLRVVLKEIAEDNQYDEGGEFENNVKESLAEEFIKMAEGKESVIDAEKIKEDFINQIASIIQRNNLNEKQAASQVKSIMNSSLTNEVIQVLSAKEISDILNSAINKVGSLSNKPIVSGYEDIIESVENIADIEEDIEEITDVEILDAEEIVNEILNIDEEI